MRALLPAFLLLLLACNTKPGDQGYHLPPKLMQQVLIDVNLAETYSTMVKDSLRRSGAKDFDSLAVYYRSVFDHYHITPAQFEASIEWYKNNPDKLDTIYTAMTDKVVKLKAVEPQHTKPGAIINNNNAAAVKHVPAQ